jgi:hypothetical protein
MTPRRSLATRTAAASLFLAILAAAPVALAQGAKPKKGAPKDAPKDTPAAAATPDPAPTPAPASSAETKADDSTDAKDAKKELPATPPEGAWDSSDTREDPSKAYYFIGLRYRGTVIPKFMVNLFVDEGSTFYSNHVGAELDIRKDNHSTVLSLGYTGFGFGDTLFFQKGKDQTPNNFSIVSSSLWGLFLGLDELWSVPIDQSHHWDFEYGFGVGLGFIFGSLTNDWVYQTSDKTGIQASTTGFYYAKCPGPGSTLPPNNSGAPNPCDPANHSNAQQTKTNNYQEPNWFGGGSIPVIFPQIYFPHIGLRYKPVKEFQARLGLGFSLTGFWFGINGDYGLEKQQDASSPATPAAKKEKEGARYWLRNAPAWL